MKRIASPEQLQTALQRLLRYTQTPRPSRTRIARQLADMAHALRCATPREVDKLTVEISTRYLDRPGAEQKTYKALEKAFGRGLITPAEFREMESEYEDMFEHEKAFN